MANRPCLKYLAWHTKCVTVEPEVPTISNSKRTWDWSLSRKILKALKVTVHVKFDIPKNLQDITNTEL